MHYDTTENSVMQYLRIRCSSPSSFLLYSGNYKKEG